MNILSSAISERLARRFRVELGDELTMSQYQLLRLVSCTDPGRISDVATFLRVTKPAASKAVKRLVGRGLLVRMASEDRRASRLGLTDEGRELLHRYETVHEQVLENLFDDLPDALSETADVMDHLSIKVLKQHAPPREICFRCGIYFRDKCLLRSFGGRVCYCHRHDGDAIKAARTDSGGLPEE
jgi:DNA-binding MarR family transcriptional regulator